MQNRSFKDKILYNKYSWLIPFHPLITWGDTVLDLNKFYKRPEINLTDSFSDLKKKNDMRHIVGLARIGQTYYNPLAVKFGSIKENFDYIKDFLKPSSFGYVTNETKKDTMTDWENNLKGLNFTNKYPKASSEDIMQYAWGITNGAKPIEEQQNQELYKILNNKAPQNFENTLYGEIRKPE